jgi:spermidine synthase
MFVFPKDMPRLNVEANHLNTQKLVEYFESDWRAVMR